MSDGQESGFEWLKGHEHELHRIPISTLLRWFLYDINAEDAFENAELFNLTPISEEGHEKELEDSYARLDSIEDIISFLSFYANATAEYAFAMNKRHLLEIPGISEDMLVSAEEPLKIFYLNMTMSSLLSAFAAATELSIIKLNGTYTEIKKETNE
jgi:hypothetical protein